ncbi:tRNA-specific adenosine deaminase subunit tad3 [Mycoemilia scoparia]|uniref:tRNA-specific adenosine deaminase subunit tad3 n=1 Tax=Mycoemilia scoparia TaxID=417184 RepID=A0A9W7ZYQ7_9FUNG|nr:tRNA-specific adenosine deaminase subunit tad3 [Mycoemilia scoparia]
MSGDCVKERTNTFTWENMKVERILTEEETRKLETIDVFTTTIEPKLANKFLKFIQNHIPKINDLEHVKRVRRSQTDDGNVNKGIELRVVLCPVDHISKEELIKSLESFDPAIIQHIQDNLAIYPVPKHSPYTMSQFNEWKSIWPISYKRPTTQDEELTGNDLEYIKKYMEIAENEARLAQESNNRKIGAVIVNPQDSKVAAIKGDMTHSLQHPLKHAIMNCIEAIAKDTAESYKTISSTSPNDSLHHKRKLDESGITSDAISAAEGGYLCQDMDVFTNSQPCVM